MHKALRTISCCLLATGCLTATARDGAKAAGTIASPPRAAETSASPEGAVPSATPLSKMPLVSTEAFAPDGKLEGRRIRGTPGVSSSSESSPAEMAASPEAFGGSRTPYTTVRVAVQALGPSTAEPTTPVTSYPFRATGKLWARWGSSWFVCTASLVKKSVLITAAHCVFDYGKKAAGWADEVRFYPAVYDSSTGPFGYFTATTYRVPTPYYKGNDTCAQRGVVCNNDLATVVLTPKADPHPGGSLLYPGNLVGWYAYGWNGYSFTRSPLLGGQTVGHVTQLGYPAAFDGGYQMQRTDAVSWYVKDGNLRNIQIGSAQTGGSSGGPWIVNLGAKGAIDASKASFGRQPAQAVVGVTSYGWVKKTYNRQGASFFGQNRQYPGKNYGGYGAGNIGKIIYDTCSAQPWAC